MAETSTIDTGTGYGRKAPSYDARLTEVGPGTPMGEAMRRYWHPIASAAALSSDVPHRTRILGEDLIVFRDKQGRPGVVAERCAHRGTSLFYGRIEEDGLRCCYHGWKFDVQGRCLEQPCEPERRRHLSVVRQPWYPVEERYGLVFVYMGPPERKPALPRYEYLENLGEGEVYQASWPNPGAEVTGVVSDYNWLQLYENAIDPVHATWLHYTHSGAQFAGTGATGFPDNYFDPYTAADRITYGLSEFGAYYNYVYYDERVEGDVGAENAVFRVELQLPNVVALPQFDRVVPDAPEIVMLWAVPVDDTHYRVFVATRSAHPMELARIAFGITQNGKNPWEMTEQELQLFPSDNEAQQSQGPITQHSEEHLVSSDRGVVMLRRLLSKMVDDVEAGRDPQGVRGSEVEPRPVKSGAFSRKLQQAAE